MYTITSLEPEKERELTEDEIQDELANYFIQDIKEQIPITFWDNFETFTKGFNPKYIEKIRTIILSNRMDIPKIAYYKEDEAIQKIRELNVDWYTDIKRAKSGLMVFELPPVLDKRWWRHNKKEDSTENDDDPIKLLPWGDIYEHTRDKVYSIISQYQETEDMSLDRINPPFYHEQGKYYYIWYVGKRSDQRTYIYEDSIDEYHKARWIPNNVNDLSGFVHKPLEDICPSTCKGLYIGAPDRVFNAIQSNFDRGDIEHFLENDANEVYDRIILPYFPTSIGKTLDKSTLQQLFSKINHCLNTNGEAYIFPFPVEGMESTMIDWFKELSPLLWQNGGQLEFTIAEGPTRSFNRALILKKQDIGETEYKVEDPLECARVAIKQILPYTNDDKVDVARTKGECQTLCEATASYAAMQYPKSFKRAMVLRAFGDFKKDPAWNYHYYFLLEDINGKYIAGSPSNLHLETESTDANNISLVTADNLEELIEKIQKDEGGKWPAAEYIKNIAYIPPIVVTDTRNVETLHKGVISYAVTHAIALNNYAASIHNSEYATEYHCEE